MTSRFTKLLVTELLMIEIYVVKDGHGWDIAILYVPEEIARSNSQDKFISWVYSEEGQLLLQHQNVEDFVAVFVMSFRDDLDRNGYATEGHGPAVLMCRAEDGRWRFFSSLNSDEDSKKVFETWAEGTNEVTVDADEADYTIYTMLEADLHLTRLRMLKLKSKAQQAEIVNLGDAIKAERSQVEQAKAKSKKT